MISKEDFEYLLENAGKDILVVMDEAYYEYTPPRNSLTPFLISLITPTLLS